jgi:hypothetical protein
LKKLILDHSHTPPTLIKINQDLSDLFADKEPDEGVFLELVALRDEIILTYLDILTGTDKKEFVEAEIKVNGALVAYANELFQASLKQLSGLIRGRKAVKKYT